MVVAAPAPAGAEFALRDGSVVTVRPVAPADAGPLLEFLQGLSLDARYRRFFSLSPDLARSATSAASPEADRFGLVACPPRSRAVVAHAGVWVTAGSRGELALAVADSFQRRGLGRLLLDQIGRSARRRGLARLEMDVLPGNAPVLGLLLGCPWPLSVSRLPGGLMCALDLRS